MKRIWNALRRAGQVALPVIAIGPGYAAYLSYAGKVGMAAMREAFPLIRLSFWCGLAVFVAVFGYAAVRTRHSDGLGA